MDSTTLLRGVRIDPKVLKQQLESHAQTSIASDHFDQWKKSFLENSASLKSANYVGGVGKIPPKETIEKIKTFELARGDHATLINNLLYACYQAEHAIDPDCAEIQIERDKYRARIKEFPDVATKIKELLKYIQENHDLVSSALKYSDMTTIGANALKISKGLESPEIIESLLTRLTDGFTQMQTAEHPGLLNFDLDYLHGPLWFLDDGKRDQETGKLQENTLVFPQSQKLNANQVGLIFHLVYIVRYFLVSELEPQCKARLTNVGELIDLGPMINCRVTKREIVAHLYNATFEARYQIDKKRRQKSPSESEDPLKPFEPSSGTNIEQRLREHITEPLIKRSASKQSAKDSLPPKVEIVFPDVRVFFRGWQLAPIE